MTTGNDERRSEHMTCLRLLHSSFPGPLQKLHGGVSPQISEAPLYVAFKSTKMHELAGEAFIFMKTATLSFVE